MIRITTRHLLRLLLLAPLGLGACSSPDGHSHENEVTHQEGNHSGEHEDVVSLSPETIAASGVVTSIVAPRSIEITLDMPGEIVPNADGLAHIVPRFPGIARQVHKGLGDPVNKGEVLAVIESNESLSPYEVTSLLSGTVIEKHITLGEFVRDDSDIYVIADLSTVWVNITVYARDLDRVRRGQRVRIVAVGGEGHVGSGTIDYVGSVLGEATRSAVARVVIPNRQRHWRPGMFITARISLEQISAPLAVEDAAVQRLEGRDVVFIQEGDAFEPRPVTLGRSDGQWVEILSGLEPGERYVAQGSFILKSELLKSEAGHEH